MLQIGQKWALNKHRTVLAPLHRGKYHPLGSIVNFLMCPCKKAVGVSLPLLICTGYPYHVSVHGVKAVTAGLLLPILYILVRNGQAGTDGEWALLPSYHGFASANELSCKPQSQPDVCV